MTPDPIQEPAMPAPTRERDAEFWVAVGAMV